MDVDPSSICAVTLTEGDEGTLVIPEPSKHPDKKKTQSSLAASSAVSAILRPFSTKAAIPPIPSINLDIKVHNVVCTVDLGCQLDLVRIALGVRNVEYNPRRFRAVVMRIQEPRTVILIFATGKIVVTGAKCESTAHLSARKCARILQKLGYGDEIKFIDFKIQNMVASCDVRFPICLDGIYRSNYQFCSYEPELFPGLVYRIIIPKVVLLIFVTGKMVLTGAKSRQELADCSEFIYPLLRAFRKQ